MDALVGETLPFVDADTALFVLSDHGFCAFRRGVNLNSWLHQNGYLTLKPDAEAARFLKVWTGARLAPTRWAWAECT